MYQEIFVIRFEPDSLVHRPIHCPKMLFVFTDMELFSLVGSGRMVNHSQWTMFWNFWINRLEPVEVKMPLMTLRPAMDEISSNFRLGQNRFYISYIISKFEWFLCFCSIKLYQMTKETDVHHAIFLSWLNSLHINTLSRTVLFKSVDIKTLLLNLTIWLSSLSTSNYVNFKAAFAEKNKFVQIP